MTQYLYPQNMRLKPKLWLGVRWKVLTRKQSQNRNYKRRYSIRFLIKFHLTYCILQENRL